MAVNNYLVRAKTWHKRLQPRKNEFIYKLYYLCFPLSRLQDIKNSFLSINSPNLFSFYAKDHWPKDGRCNETWIREILKEHKISTATGEIVLLTLPRLFGYVFNPVSFWFCLDKNDKIRAVFAEVRNTFGEWHNYLLHHKDLRVIEPSDTLISKKMFHVSPFMHVEGSYKFRFQLSTTRVGAWIDYQTSNGEMLKTNITGKRIELNKWSILKEFFINPALTFKVIILIHYQALKLLFKGIKYVPKPKLPSKNITK